MPRPEFTRQVLEALTAVFFLALMFLSGCAAPPPQFIPDHPQPATWQDTIPIHAAVFVRGDGKVCSGVAVAPTSVVTAAHCARAPADLFEVVAFPGVSVTAAVARVDPTRDLAWLTLDRPLQVVARVAKSLPNELDVVFAVGFGCFQQLDVHAGLFIMRKDDEMVLEMGVCPGDSGGPVFNARGEVIGITVRRSLDKPVAAAVVYLEGERA